MLFQTCRCINSMFVEHMWQTIRTVVPTFQRNHLFVVDFMVLGKFLKFWPDRIINLKAFAIFALSIVMEVLPEFSFIIKNLNNVQALFMCLHEFISLLVYVLKVLVFFYNRKIIFRLIEDLREEWKTCRFNKLWLFMVF